METAYTDPEGMLKTLEGYDRAMEVWESDDGRITVKSGKYPHWRRFQRDLHGTTVNVQGHGYVMSHVHKRKMTYSEYDKDENCKGDLWMIPYEERPELCIVTLTPVIDMINDGIEGPSLKL